jgi:hypothetical protein
MVGQRRLPALPNRYQHWAAAFHRMSTSSREVRSTRCIGVSCVGIVAFDLISNRQIVCHSRAPILRLEDAVRVPSPCRGCSCLELRRTAGTYKLVDEAPGTGCRWT